MKKELVLEKKEENSSEPSLSSVIETPTAVVASPPDAPAAPGKSALLGPALVVPLAGHLPGSQSTPGEPWAPVREGALCPPARETFKAVPT